MKNLKGLIALAFAGLMGVTLSTFAGDGECIVLANVPCEITDGWDETMAFDSQSDLGGYYCTKYTWSGWQFTVAMADNGLIAEPEPGYKFDGWYTMTANRGVNDDLNISYATVQISKNATIEWKEIKNAKTFDSVPFVVAKYVPLYKVTFDKQGGGGGSDSVEVANGDEMPEIEPPSRDGYDFLGYFTKTGTEGTQYYSDMGKGKVTSYDLSKDITLYAHWQGKKFVVTFDDRGPDIKDGQGKLEVTLGEEGEALSVSVKIPTATERTFLGYWNEELDERFWDEEGTWKGGVWTVPSNVVVRAHWKANEYMVKFNENGGSGKYSDVSVAMNVPFELPDGGELAKENHVFAGWALSSDAKEAKYEGGATIRIADDKTALVDGAITYYAFWQDMRRTVHFHADSKAILSTNELQKTAGQAYGELPTASWPNDWYAFDGWWSADGSRIFEDTPVPVDSPAIDLYAHWTTNSYYIAFDGREPTSGEMPVQEFKFDTPAALTKNAFEKTGYEFAGWATNSATPTADLNDGELVINLLATRPNETNAIFAVWLGYPYTVRFYGNGGTNTMADQEFRYGVAQNLSSNQFVREGYAFAGWATDPTNGVKFTDGESVGNLSAQPDAVIKLFAKWARGGGELSEYSVAADCDKLNLVTNTPGWSVEKYMDGEKKVGVNDEYIKVIAPPLGGGTYMLSASLPVEEGEFSFYAKTDMAANAYQFRCELRDGRDERVGSRLMDCKDLPNAWTNLLRVTIAPENYPKAEKIVLYVSRSTPAADGSLCLDFVQWKPTNPKPVPVALTFRRNDGTSSPDDIVDNVMRFASQEVGELPQLQNRGDVKFVGWMVGGVCIDDTWSVPDVDVQLFAKWDDGSHPEPGTEDAAAVFAAKVAGGRFILEFTGSDVFDYLLMTNGDLSVKSWGELERLQGTGEVQTFEPAIDSAQPQLFYRIDTIQRQ